MDTERRDRKPRSRRPADGGSSQGKAARRSFEPRAYALPIGDAKAFLTNPLPPGVEMRLVVGDAAAEKELLAWAPAGIQRIDRTGAEPNSRPKNAEVDPSAFVPSARARALLQGKKIAEADLKAAGGAFDLAETRALLNGISRQAVEKRVRDGSLLGVPGPSNRNRYPTLQFTPDGLVPGLKAVKAALPTRNPWAVLNFLVRPDDRLDGRAPIDVLREGDVDLVVSVARGMGLQGG